MTLIQLLAAACLAVKQDDAAKLAELADAFERRTGRRLTIADSASGLGVSIVGRP